jgi:hypothetical protein
MSNMSDVEWHPVSEEPPETGVYRIRGKLQRGSSRVQCDRALWHSRAQYWTDADGYEILGVTHWTEPQESESVWHLVSEAPDNNTDYFVWGPKRDVVEIATARQTMHGGYWEQDGCEIHGVTHYAVIVYPNPPEEA